MVTFLIIIYVLAGIIGLIVGIIIIYLTIKFLINGIDFFLLSNAKLERELDKDEPIQE